MTKTIIPRYNYIKEVKRMNSKDYSNENVCLRNYDGKCSGKPSWKSTEVSTSGLWIIYVCNHHKEEMDNERKTNWTEVLEVTK